MASFESPVKLDPSNSKKKRENISWDKCIICQRVSLEQTVNMRDVGKSSFVEAMCTRKDSDRNKSVIYKISVKTGKYRIPRVGFVYYKQSKIITS
jgi:hypothetical protein